MRSYPRIHNSVKHVRRRHPNLVDPLQFQIIEPCCAGAGGVGKPESAAERDGAGVAGGKLPGDLFPVGAAGDKFAGVVSVDDAEAGSGNRGCWNGGRV